MGFFKDDGPLEYDVRKRARAGTAATLRAVVAIYIMYLGSELIRNAGSSPDFPLWAGWVFGILFLAAGTVFGGYIWNRYKADLEEAKLLPPEEDAEDPEEPEDE